MSPAKPKISLPLILAALATVLLWGAPAASASKTYEVELMDDQLLLGKPDDQVSGRVAEFLRLGVDTLKLSAFWRDVAPSPSARVRPNFNAADPESPRYRWGDLDRVVRIAKAAGLKLSIEITGPFPFWASHSPGRKNAVYKPRVNYYRDFATAVAKRYAEQADRYGIWNEPNQGAWLQPQSTCTRIGCRVVAPRIYRQLARAAYPAIKAADPTATVLIGELAPSGSLDAGPTRPLRPLTFLRFMACRTPGYRRIRGGTCRGFRSIAADGIGHHPYSVLPFLGPGSRSPSRDDAALGDTKRLLRVVDRLQRVRGLRNPGGGKFPVYYSEFGYQTNPPDPFSGVSPRRQGRRLQEAAYRVWLMPRVKSLNQFRLTDGPVLRVRGPKRFLEFQSGLRFSDDRPKPAYGSFPDPFRANRRRVRSGRQVVFWGQVRPGGAHQVVIERKVGSRFTELARVRTDAVGVFVFRLRPRASGSYRFIYTDSPIRGESDSITVSVR